MEQTKAERFLSIDVLRGWTVAAMLLVNNAGDWNHVYPWLEHAVWHGCTPADLIFPFFLLIVGVSMALALEPQLERGADIASLRSTLCWRGLRLICLGLLLHVIAMLTIDGRAFRLPGVLQRIGICFTIAGLCMLYCRQARTRWIVLLGILLIYAVLLLTGGTLDLHTNLADRLDSLLLGHVAYSYDAVTGLAHDPEGVLSTLPAIASVLSGIQAAGYLRQGHIRQLSLLGLTMIVIASGLSVWLPLNKQLGTPSFILLTSGMAYVLIAVLHFLIDRRQWSLPGRSFGINAIAAYAGSWIATCLLAMTGWDRLLYQNVFYPLFAPHVSENFASFAYALAFTSVFAGLMMFMAHKKWRVVI